MKRLIVLYACLSLLMGCTGSGPKYQDTPTVPVLEVPPDLTGIPVDDRASSALLGSSTSGFSGSSTRSQDPIVNLTKKILPEFDSVRVVRAGSQRWLVAKTEAEPLWLALRSYLIRLNFTIADESPETGIIETAWQETRPLEEDKTRSKTARFFANLHSTGLREKIRIRLERGLQPGTMEVYLSQKLYEEVALTEGGADVVQTIWNPIAPDPVREKKLLQLLLVYLGSSKLQSQQMIEQAGSPRELARTQKSEKNILELILLDTEDRAWRRLGLALDHIGFSVQDRDRTEGLYYIRHAGILSDTKKRGFFSRMFGSDTKKADEYYQVRMFKDAELTKVEVRDKNGKPETSNTGEEILKLLYEQLKY